MENWTKTELRNVLKTPPQYGANASAIDYSPDENLRFVRITDIDDSGRLKEEGKVGISFENGSAYILEEDDIIIARTGATVGKALCFKETYGKCAFAGYLIRFKIDAVKFNINFFNQYLLSPFFKRWIQDNLRAGAQPNVNAEEYQSVILPNPPLGEQKKIAEILSTWDKAVETTEKLIAAKQKLKKSLMQRLLTGSQRFPEFHGQEWKVRNFGEFLTESRVSGSHGASAKKITVKLYGKGVFEKRERNQGSENTKYYKRKTGQFIYSKLDFLNGAFGLIPEKLNDFESTLDLPTFNISEKLDSSYLLYYVSREEFYSRFTGSAEGGRKARRVQPDEFLQIKLKVPSLEEQKKIAAVLEKSDAEINVLQSGLDALRQQKRGLMQKLLTGRVRVKSDENSNAAFEN